MKKISLFFLPLLLLSGCTIPQPEKKQFSVYLDYSVVKTEEYQVRVTSANAYGTGNCSFSITLAIKNLTPQSQEVTFSNPTLIRESTGASYETSIYPNIYSYTSSTLKLDSEIEGSISYTSTIPTTLTDKYYFSVDFNNIYYKVFLYETPDELRENLTIRYMVNNQVVNTQTVKKGRKPNSYLYETVDHQSYCSSWKDSKNNPFTVNTVVEENMTVTGTLSSVLRTSTTSSDTYTFITYVNYVPSDGVIVVQEKYQNKDVCIASGAISNFATIKTVYLPKTLYRIYSNNFINCGIKTIYFAGTQEQWVAATKDYATTLPATINLVFNTSYSL